MGDDRLKNAKVIVMAGQTVITRLGGGMAFGTDSARQRLEIAVEFGWIPLLERSGIISL
ncbi:MAG: hypothetical protein QGG19_10255 [Alphaproteobacteria bacterium]|jgi:uncharacterized membrane protein|nr:hypothetical protein [Alphaproteobacteria bacterium]MDP6254833.1 hypothetical protein [Alphaproteobacteria bacterium]|tara:strand:- start:352 stop:528 length:177 start_codon:yes stop_codon:yes gene_type:complete